MKVKRSNRVVDMTRYLLERPRTLISLKFFAQRYDSAKSSISEDLGILKQTFQERGTGILETIPGATGGVRFIPYILREEAQEFIDSIVDEVNDESRLLPGGYVYLSDLLSRPDILRQVGRLIATQYLNQDVNVVMTVATKGIPIAQSVANYLNVPFVIVRNDSHITEGSTVSVNYVSGSSKRIEKMELSRRSLQQGARVLVVDDFMKGGGTLNGMASLIKEFDATLIGMTVFAEGEFSGDRLVKQYTSLIKVNAVNPNDQTIEAQPGNYLSTVFGTEMGNK
ncbi:pur operon repressor [Paucilactobacillus wasatchensis]|uniref:Transcription regulator associated with purine metabolism, PurR n=1 Tax=Paucilactobacillus wasatchensis TaxID=1335616 RepID=A0A0D0YY80_9LACO|nr:pur operon repressor [Paucilactobacillus wasatchensis]KIS04159.1 transcription regulator associated with purine metabolism, PurR [Paucilactobacillus wasatchensis]